MGTSNFTATLCIILLSATLTSSGWYGWGNKRGHGSNHRSGHRPGHRSRNCGFLGRVECTEPTNPTDGTVLYSERGFESKATYSCHSGFELLGDDTRTCLSDETWSGATPTCVFTGCGTLTAPLHGDVSYTGRHPGDNATIICDQGYTLTGPGARTCHLGGWNGASGDCVRISCPVLSPPSDGSVTRFASPVFEDVVSYSCDPGYALDGTNSRSCLSTGAWSGDDPTCAFAVKCPAIIAPDNGGLELSGPFSLGTKATYSCDLGLASGDRVRYCVGDGTWTGTEPTCSTATGGGTLIICDEDTKTVSCSGPGVVINIISAYYGRTAGTEVCSHTSIANCPREDEKVLARVRSVCDAQTSCDLLASSFVFGDICPGTDKYLEISYNCTAGLPGNGLVGNCNDVYDSIATKPVSSGVYTVYPCGNATCPVSLYCDMTTDGGSWTVIQRRINGATHFYRNWAAYRDGFGSPTANVWLGNENIHDITSQGSYELRVDLADFEGNTVFAKYSSFSVGPESDKYRLSVSGYQPGSTAGDSLTELHNNMQFSTQDSDNDKKSTGSCANLYKGAWWYEDCYDSSLNGEYFGGAHSEYTDYGAGVIWITWKGPQYSVKSVMMIREII